MQRNTTKQISHCCMSLSTLRLICDASKGLYHHTLLLILCIVSMREGVINHGRNTDDWRQHTR